MFPQSQHNSQPFEFRPSQSELPRIRQLCRNPPPIVVPNNITNMTMPSARSSNPSSASTSMSFRYYQPPKTKQEETESEDESSEEERRKSSRKSSTPNQQPAKRGACTHCKTLKVRCHFANGHSHCQRCILNKLQCTVVGRKKRRAVATHEELLLKSHKQDLEIVNLLHQFDEITASCRIQSWIEKANYKRYARSSRSPGSPQSGKSSDSSSFDRDHTSWTSSMGYGEFKSPCSPIMDMNAAYLTSLSYPTLSPHCRKYSTQELLMYFPNKNPIPYLKAPEIVARGIIQPDDVGKLFELYFKHINPYFAILDPQLHTPKRLFWNSHFLFTLICCISTKYAEPKLSSMCPLFVEFARDMAGKTLVEGRKTIDECQAFLIQSAYQLPRKRFEDQRTWLTMGLAFSLAQELKLNEPPAEEDLAVYSPGGADSRDPIRGEMAERIKLNRTRTWLLCYCLDANFATQFGKPAILDAEDCIARHCRDWYLSSPYSLPNDIHLVSSVESARVMRRFRLEVEQLEAKEKEDPPKRVKIAEVINIVVDYHRQLQNLHLVWNERFEIYTRPDDYMWTFRADTARMMNAFNRLVVLFYGLQRIISVKTSDEGAGSSKEEVVRNCIATAKEVIAFVVDKLHPTRMLRYCLETTFLVVSFAAAGLLSFLRPGMSTLLQDGDTVEIIILVRRLTEALRDDQVSKDEHGEHAPSYYARYLSKQLRRLSATLPHQSAILDQDFSSQTHYDETARGYSANRPDSISMDSSVWMERNSGAMYTNTSPVLESDSPVQSLPSNMHYPHAGADVESFPLPGYSIDYSMETFLQTVSEPQFTEKTPPPEDSKETVHWWQQMYPVSSQTIHEAQEWPMVVDVQSSVGASIRGHHFHPNF